jgi:hypothetical protein
MQKFFIFLFVLASATFSGFKFPENAFSPGWDKAENVEKFKANNLYGHINGGAELFLEFGFQELQVQRYSKNDFELNLEIYHMENPTAALGIYLMKCGKETPLPGLATRNTGNAYQITAVKGDCFFQVNNFSGEADFFPVMKTALEFILDQIPATAPIKIFELLPHENRVVGSEKLIRGPYALQPIFTFGDGDVLLLNREIFAVFGDYQFPDGAQFSRLIIPYPDSGRATAALKNLFANLDPYLTVLQKNDTGFIFQDFQKKYGVVSLTNSLLEIKIGLPALPEN